MSENNRDIKEDSNREDRAREDRVRKEYLEFRNLLFDQQREAARSFDQYMITLNAGAIALSITFLSFIKGQVHSTCILYFSWILFGVALFAVLISNFLSYFACKKGIELADEEYKKGVWPPGKTANSYDTPIEYLNRASLLAFCFGVIFLMIFCGGNLNY